DNIYAAGDVAGLSGIWPNAMKQGETAAYNMCGVTMEYQDRYAMKNTMNFYGLVTLSLGRGVAEEGDEVIICHDSKNYKKAILRDGKLDSILLQGDMDYSGVYQYLIKNQIDLSDKKDKIFQLSFADFYDINEDGQYSYR
ncbi:MAG TPA: NAD(P)/FAD-dependent oxidoreductase, partial [Candidatus Pelethocola excrementipullorum]|nr:NAD(P)/FAD-dependent oxidoreductase [Candidatus Pelethocola excrementipullorum]